MAEIVNLRLARKRKVRGERERVAAQNRQRYGLTKAERLAANESAERQDAMLDGHFLDRSRDRD